ncbi:MAG TPA: phosphotransferase [Streptosporangiaceae bacterium]
MDDVTLLTEADAVPVPAAAAALHTEYGLAGELDRLPGEADDNFLLRTPAGERYVAKFAHPRTDPEVIATQARALRHLESTTDLPVQHVIPALDGRLTTRDHDRAVLVTRYLPGQPMRHTAMTPALRRHLGVTLAVLARALTGVPAKPRPLLWDIAQLPALRPLAAELPPQLGRDLLTGLIGQFQERTEPRLKTLRTQLVHNDFNLDNILIDTGGDHIAGILDFGDMTVTALANDVAVAACYQLSDSEDLVGPALDLIAGYHDTTPLTGEELDLLPDLVLARLTARVIIARWRALRFPGNQEYILRSTAMASAHLNRLLATPDGEFAQRILEHTHA